MATSIVNDGQLIRRINKSLTREAPVEPLRSTDYVRASSVAHVCFREEVLVSILRKPRTRIIDTDLRLTFIHGTGLHFALQDLVLPMCGDVFWGQWRCRQCSALHRATGCLPAEESWNRSEEPPPGWKRLPKVSKTEWQSLVCLCPSACGGCKAVCAEFEGEALFSYEEFTFHDEEMNIGGHNDGFLKFDDFEGFGVLEAKSIGSLFAVKKVPMADHVIQANLYMHFTGCMWAIILYWHKGTNGIPAFVQHAIAYDPDVLDMCKRSFKEMRSTLRLVEDIQAKDLPDLAKADELKALPLPERICETVDCDKAKKCSVADECFQR